MPKEDGTGPFGEGPQTGWGRGRCAGFAFRSPGRFKRARRRSFGGFGRGLRRAFSKEEEKELLEEKERMLEEELAEVREAKERLNDRSE